MGFLAIDGNDEGGIFLKMGKEKKEVERKRKRLAVGVGETWTPSRHLLFISQPPSFFYLQLLEQLSKLSHHQSKASLESTTIDASEISGIMSSGIVHLWITSGNT